jgi:hypothetical protein
MSIVLVVAGFAVALLLAILGVDLVRACRTGPKWKRRLIGAGLVLLVAMGFAPNMSRAADAESKPAAPAVPAAADKGLAESTAWQRILAAWNEASEIASGKRGDYPFDEKGKQQVLANLKQAEADAAELQKTKLISEPEAGLLLKDLAVLTAGVQAKRPTEMKMATCYEPMLIQPGHESLKRLSDRLPLLEKLSAAQTIHPEVVEKVLAGIEADIASLAKEESLKEFAKAEERQKAEKTRDAAKAAAVALRSNVLRQAASADAAKDTPRVSPAATTEYARTRIQELEKRLARLEKMESRADEVNPQWIDALITSTRVDVRFMGDRKFLSQVSDADLPRARAAIDRAAAVLQRLDALATRPYQAPESPKPASPESLAGKRLEETDAWKSLTALWTFGREIAAGRRGPFPFNTQQREQLLADLEIVGKNVAALEKAGLLSSAEAGLLGQNLDAMITRIQKFRPEELRMATCYVPVRIVSPNESVDRLAARLPLLEKLAAAETLHAEVVEKVLAGIEADIATLAKEESLKEFAKAEDRQKAEKTRDAAKEAAQRLRERITPMIKCYMRIPLNWPEPKKEQSAARLKILETPAATAALRPEVLRKAAANARDKQDAS